MSRVPKVPTLPKLCGADVELGNFIAGVHRAGGTGAEASRALLRAFAAVTSGIGDLAPVPFRRRRFNPQDLCRVYLPGNGGCAYIDLDHLELCLPEVVSAYDHVAAWHAMLRLAQGALAAANAVQPDGQRIQAMVNNSDGRGNSYGGHLNVLLTRPAWEGLMQRKLHHLAYLSAYQASSLVFTGQGKVGSENDAPAVRYQLSQRADFIETLLGPQTTFFRPLVNTRDEPHCEHARLHLISFDSTLCQVASLLRTGVTQLVLAMIEADRVNPGLALEDPLAAVQRWSHDPSLEARVRLVNGRKLTAVEVQLRFLEEARRFARQGRFEGVVPRAEEILDLWESTLDQLARRDWPALARRLDWVLKLAMLQRALAQRPELDWSAPELKYLDHLFASLDPEEGLFWAWSRAGLVDTVVPEAQIRRFCEEPPSDTRAWGRAMLLRRAGPDPIDQVDWDAVRFRLGSQGGGAPYQTVHLTDPLGSTRAEWENCFSHSRTLEELLENLGARSDSVAAVRGPMRISAPGVRVTQHHGGQDGIA